MSKRITLEELNERIKKRFPRENFTVVKFTGMGEEGIIQCNQCQEKIVVSKMSNFFAKNKRYGCVKCHGLWRDREIKLVEIKKYYDIVDTHVYNTHTYYIVKCKKCGHQRDTSLKNLMVHLQCGCETGVYRNRTAEEFIKEVNANRYNDSYTLVGEYKNQTTKVLLKHDQCGFIWSVRPADVIAGGSCPKCVHKKSKGEKLISFLLEKYNIQYEPEKYLENSKQRFDFYLPEYNMAIEYNGEQHYKETNFFRNSLACYQKNDERKREYCKEHEINLIEIPYTLKKDEIEIIIQKISSTTSLNDVESSDSK